MYCKKCGTYIDDDSVFCSYCGMKQTDRNQQGQTEKEVNKMDENIFFKCKDADVIGFRKDIIITNTLIQHGDEVIRINDIVGFGFVAIKNPSTVYQMGYIGGPPIFKMPGFGMKFMKVAIRTLENPSPYVLEFSSKSGYSKFVDILWKLCISQVIVYICNRLKNGEKFFIGNYIISDEEIVVRKEDKVWLYDWKTRVGEIEFYWNSNGTCHMYCNSAPNGVDINIGYEISPNILVALCNAVRTSRVRKLSDLIK